MMLRLALVPPEQISESECFEPGSLQDRYHLLIHFCLDAGTAELQLLGEGGDIVVECHVE